MPGKAVVRMEELAEKFTEELTLELKFEKVRNLRPIDDVCFEYLAAQPGVCREMLRTILEDPGLEVKEVTVQSSERNLYGRSVRLDALCTLGSGRLVNIEVQRSDNDDHLKRARYNAAVITSKNTNPGDNFKDIPDLIVVYISEFDFLKQNLTTYHIEKVIRETGTPVDDGLHEIFVNTVVKDGSDISDLMSCFKRPEFDDPKFPVLSYTMKNMKETEKGVSAMCAVMKHYEDIAEARGEARGEVKGVDKFALLLQKLLAAGRQSDIELASKDPDARNLLFKEFGLAT